MPKNLSLVILILICKLGEAQVVAPLELVQKVFTDKNFAQDIASYSTGEYNGHPNANDFSKNTKLSFRLLNQYENTAVVNITLIDSLGNGIDTYAHLKKNKDWKIEAFRALAMTGFIQQVLQEMEKMTDEQIDTLIQQEKETLKSKEDFYLELENMRLTLALDDVIIAHFEKNSAQFEQLLHEVQAIELDKNELAIRTINLGEKIAINYKKLLISTISTSYSCENCIMFTIGGMVDNTVGYIYISNINDLPKMNPSRFIMIREIGKGWYLFKTT